MNKRRPCRSEGDTYCITVIRTAGGFMIFTEVRFDIPYSFQLDTKSTNTIGQCVDRWDSENRDRFGGAHWMLKYCRGTTTIVIRDAAIERRPYF